MLSDDLQKIGAGEAPDEATFLAMERIVQHFDEVVEQYEWDELPSDHPLYDLAPHFHRLYTYWSCLYAEPRFATFTGRGLNRITQRLRRALARIAGWFARCAMVNRGDLRSASNQGEGVR